MKKVIGLFRKTMRKFANKFNILTIVIGCFTLLFAVSYSYFVLTTDEYKVTEMYMGELTYGIEIAKSSTSSSLTINNKSVTVPNDYTGTVFINVSSYNPVKSKYKLQYSITTPNSCTSSSCVIKVTDESGWEAQSFLKSEGENLNDSLNTKKIKVSLINTSGAAIIVNFDVSGGYSYNSYNDIASISNSYSFLPNTKYVDENDEVYFRDVVRKDLDCPATATLTKCLYGGESIRNYVKYPSNAESANYRILGLYKENNVEYVKMIAINDTGSQMQNSAVSSALTTYHGTLNDTGNKFFTGAAGVTLLNEEDYANTGLDESYAKGDGTKDYWVDGTTYNYINRNNILATKDSGNAYIKPVITLNTNAYINYGTTGTSQNPYTFSTDDLIITKITINGTAATATPTTGSCTLTPACQNGTVTWENNTHSLLITITDIPTICSLAFTGNGCQ